MYALEESMKAGAQTAGLLIQSQLYNYEDMVKEFANDPILNSVISDPTDPNYAEVNGQIQAHAKSLAELHGFSGVYVLGADGVVPYTGVDASSREYFQIAKNQGLITVTDPLVNLTTGGLDMFVAAPLYDSNNRFHGCVAISIDPAVFSDLIEDIKIGEGSTAGVLDQYGTFVAHTNIEEVYNRTNNIELAQTNAELTDLALLMEDAIAGNESFGSYYYDGIDKFMAYAQVPMSNGWSVFISASQDVFLSQMTESIIKIIGIALASLVVAFVIVSVMSKRISNPITLCAERLDKLAAGDLNTPVPEINSNDETGRLATSTKSITHTLSSMISDMSTTLESMGNGNLTATLRSEYDYVGDFHDLYVSVDKIQKNLSGTISQINLVSSQVSSGSDQVAAGATSLANGSIEQTGSIDALCQTIDQMNEQITQTALDSQKSKESNEHSHRALAKSQVQMAEMVNAMGNISNKSKEISKIIKAIDDIAFQTNILSLNAAVEAARAGSAGKGFAVVADEVRNLATKSAQSAKDTAMLIEETVKVVSEGNKIAVETSESINAALSNATELGTLVESIADASTLQAESAHKVKNSIDQISQVVQRNSATAEESASASNELSSQAFKLKDLVANFTISPHLSELYLSATSPTPALDTPTGQSYTGAEDKY